MKNKRILFFISSTCLVVLELCSFFDCLNNPCEQNISRTAKARIKAMKIVEFRNSIDPDEVPHNELPHPDLHCLSSLLILSHDIT